MNNELKYHGKTLNEMSDNELNQQYVLNRQRIIGIVHFLLLYLVLVCFIVHQSQLYQ